MENNKIVLSDKQKLFFSGMRGCNYDIVCYLTIEDILERITILNPVYYAVSPIHNLDKNNDGILKKEHYHIILCFGTKKRGTQLVRLFNTTEIRLINTSGQLKGSFEYLTHETENAIKLGKVKYEKSKLISNNIDYFNNLDNSLGCDNSFDIIDRIMSGCATRDLVKLYGKDFIYHRKDYINIVDIILLEEHTKKYKLELPVIEETGEIEQIEF